MLIVLTALGIGFGGATVFVWIVATLLDWVSQLYPASGDTTEYLLMLFYLQPVLTLVFAGLFLAAFFMRRNKKV